MKARNRRLPNSRPTQWQRPDLHRSLGRNDKSSSWETDHISIDNHSLISERTGAAAYSPAMSVELQVDELVLVRQSSFSSLVFAVKDVRVVGQALVVPNVLVQAILILTWRGEERKRELKTQDERKDEKVGKQKGKKDTG